MNILNSTRSKESLNPSNESSNFIEKTKNAVRKTLITAWISASSMWPVATTTSTTVIPASINTITAIAPISSSNISTISLLTASSLMTACGWWEDWPEEPIKPTPTEKDTIAPNIEINNSEVDITWWKEIKIKDNHLYIWDILALSRSDNKSRNCNIEILLNWKIIPSWTIISEEWTLSIKVSDEAGNTKNADIKLNFTKNAPSIAVNNYEINIFWWVTVNINNNKLLFWDEEIASRNDDNLESCKVTLNFNWQEIKSWNTINEAWKLTLTVTNKNEKSSTAEITLKNETIYGLESLQNRTLQVDQEINLLDWITFADGVNLTKTQIELDWEKITISDPYHYKPEYPWTISVIFTVKWKGWNTAEINVDNLNIKPLDYKSLEISNTRPVDILPIIWQVESWDKKCYEHIEHLRVAEATRIRDMMREYGAGKYCPEEYQQLMSRLNTGMTWEVPKWYNNYESIWGAPFDTPSNHALTERSILNTLVNHANLKIVCGEIDWRNALLEFVINNPSSINIFWNSNYAYANNKADYDVRLNKKNVKDLCNSKNIIIFAAWTNISQPWWIIKNKIYNWGYEADEHGRYSLASLANSDKNTEPNSNLMVTIATEDDWDINQTNVYRESSKYPVWFSNDVLFSGRAFPQIRDGEIYWPSWRYTTSDTNYFNVALTDLCFQMLAEVKDAGELLNMIRATSLTDYIRLDGQTQALHLINPVWFFQKYLMPTDLPSNIKSKQNTPLNKWYYKWVIFDIPWAEVKINWEWIAYNDINKSLIKSQNPMNLQWRINWDLCKKLWYKWKNLKWKIIVVDDKWNGLNMYKETSISVQ